MAIMGALATALRFHDLRHTAATLLLAEGVHPKVVADLLAHTQVSVTLDVYSHVTATMQREAVDTLDRVIGRQNGSQGHRR
jgi:integrase